VGPIKSGRILCKATRRRRWAASGVLLVLIAVCILLFRQRPAQRGHRGPHENHEPKFMTVPILARWGPAQHGVVDLFWRSVMKWETPQATEFRFGMEITMYVANR
jgi:coenzyme PQQ precursor peptide PqqA